MATAFRCKNEFGVWEEKRDIKYEGEAKNWAKGLLDEGKYVEIGFFVFDHEYVWVSFSEYIKNKTKFPYHLHNF